MIDKPLNMIGYVIIRGMIMPRLLIITITITGIAITYLILSNTDAITKILMTIFLFPYWLETLSTIKTSKEFTIN